MAYLITNYLQNLLFHGGKTQPSLGLGMTSGTSVMLTFYPTN